MTILVTGAAGFIGMHVALRLLSRGEDVIGIDNINAYYSPSLKRDRIDYLAENGGDAFRFFEVDFSDGAALRACLADAEFDRIIHLGAQAGVRYSLDHPSAYVQSNLVGHATVLEVARERRVSHLVYASSSSVYGGNEKLPSSVEHRVDHPLSLYAATKRSNELLSEAYAYLFRMPCTGLRFFTVYGPWGRPDMAPWRFTEAILEGRPITIVDDERVRRDFTYIDDIVGGVISCIDRPPADDQRKKPGGSLAPHALYNLGNSHPIALGRFVEIIENACGRKAVKDNIPLPLGDVVATSADIGPARKDLGFNPSTPIEVGIPRFVEWYRRYRAI